MNLIDYLEIVLFTYNRDYFLEKTMEQLLSENSPVKDISITIYDNHSDDNTESYIKNLQKKYKNIKYFRPKMNNWCGNFLMGVIKNTDKKYIWYLADDDVYDWTHWNEVEKAMEEDNYIICTATYLIKDKSNMPQVLQQMSFYPSNIYNAKCFNLPAAVVNTCIMAFTMFWQYGLITAVINYNKPIYICDNWIVNNGMIGDEDNPKRDMSYGRGLNKQNLCLKKKNMSWIVGYANVLSMLWDKNLIENSMEIAETFQNRDFNSYIKALIEENIINMQRWSNIIDIYALLSIVQRKRFKKIFYKILFKKIRRLIKRFFKRPRLIYLIATKKTTLIQELIIQ